MESVSKTISIGDYDILSSGSVIIPTGVGIDFTFDELHFKIEFTYEKGDNDNFTEKAIKTNVISHPSAPSYLLIQFVNCIDNFFATTTEPLNVATFKNRQLLLRCSFNSINKQESEGSIKEDILLHYTWSLRKEAQNG